MKLNRGGLISSGVYAGIFLVLIGLEFFTDSKGVALLGQLAVFPAGILLAFSGLLKIIPADSWIGSGYFALGLSFVISYLVGWAFSAIVRLQDRFEK
jgi:hypothetical protein